MRSRIGEFSRRFRPQRHTSISKVLFSLFACDASSPPSPCACPSLSASNSVCSSGFFQIPIVEGGSGDARAACYHDMNNDGFADAVEMQGRRVRVRMWDNDKVPCHTLLLCPLHIFVRFSVYFLFEIKCRAVLLRRSCCSLDSRCRSCRTRAGVRARGVRR